MESALRGSSVALVAQAPGPGFEEVWELLWATVDRHQGLRCSVTYPGRAHGAYFTSPADAISMLASFRNQTNSSHPTRQLRLALGYATPSVRGTLDQVAALLTLAHPGQVLVAAPLAHAIAGHDLHPQPLGTYRLRNLERVEEVYQLSFPGEPDQFPPLRSLDHLPHNLPAQLTSFVGRQEAIQAVMDRLNASRLVTLTGSGGSGKTRLALRVGAELLDQYPDGVWFVDLSSLSDPALVSSAVAGALQVSEAAERPTVAVLRSALADRRLLLVLDNCEHLITSCAHLVSQLLSGAPRISILATSREPLSIAGEAIWPVPALAVPDPAGSSPDQLVEYEAVQLFVHRARAVQPTFLLTDKNGPAVATICRRLDGIPLALELAAARTRILSVQQIAERLDDRLRLLSSNGRTEIPRHQTLRAALDWSYGLLTDAERVFWRRLAVFGGSFSLEAVEGICAWGLVEPSAVLDLLAQLVDKSLVVAEEQTGEKRYRLLETMRQYARAQLADVGEEDELFGRYCEWYITWSHQSDRTTMGPPDWLDRLAKEHDNLRQAIQWALESGRGDYAVRLSAEIWFFWMVRGYTSDWSKLIQVAEVPMLESHPEAYANAVRGVGALYMHLGYMSRAEEVLRRSLALSRTVGDGMAIAAALNNLSVVLQNTGQFEEGQTLLAEGVQINESLGLPLRAAWVRVNLGNLYFATGRLLEARQCFEQSLAQQIPLGERSGEAFARESLALVLMAMGDLEGARVHLEASLKIRQDLDDPRGIGASLGGLGELALRQGDLGQAEHLLWQSVSQRQKAGAVAGINTSLDTLGWLYAAKGEWTKSLHMIGAAEALRQRQGVFLWPIYEEETAKRLAPAYRALGQAAAAEEFAAGGRLSLEELLQMAKAATGTQPPPTPAMPNHPALTQREQEIIRLLAQGMTAREIGQQLYLSPRTVEKHEENARNKLGVPNRAALVAWVAQHGRA